MSGRWLCLSALLLALPLPAFAQVTGAARDRQQAGAVRPQTASIAGHVMNADTGRPLRLVRVTATAPEITDGRVTTTDENGAFEFTQLPAGHYTVSASKTGYITVNFGQRRPLRPGRPIDVRDGQRVRDIDFRLPRGSAISGRVLDQDGEPVVRASVRAMRYRFVQGERRIEPGGAAETDDRGHFRIYGLQPGTYFVSATGQTGVIVLSGRITNIEAEGPPSVAYMPTYYPGVPALSDAAPVTLSLSDDVAGIDFTLQLVTAALVSGVVVGPGGPARNAMIVLVPEESRGVSGQTYSGRVERDGIFTIRNVPPGRYTAIARGMPGRGGGGGEQDLSAAVPVSVYGPVVSGVNLTLAPGLTLSGQVVFEGAATPSFQDFTRMRIGLWAPAAASLPMLGGNANTAPRQDGTFSIPNVPAGARMVRVSGLQNPWALKTVYLDGRDVTDEMVELKAGEVAGRVTVVVTDKATTLTGTVHDEQDQPLTGVTVIAFATDATLWRPQSRFIQAARSGGDGGYTLRGLPPGEYFVCASDDVDQGEWYDPELLQTLRAQANKVMLQEGDAKSVDLRLGITSPPRP